MSSIQIKDLRPAGFELFQDSESFLYELTDDQMISVEGGGRFGFRRFGGGLQSLVNININITVFTIGNTINANTIGNGNSLIGLAG